MGLFDGWKKQKKRETLSVSRFRGQAQEDEFVAFNTFQGKAVKRTGRGSDYKIGKTYYEIKSSRTAPLSRLQKRTRKRLKGRYKVVRPDNYW